MTAPQRPASTLSGEMAGWSRAEMVRLEGIASDDVRYRIARDLLAFWRRRTGPDARQPRTAQQVCGRDGWALSAPPDA